MIFVLFTELDKDIDGRLLILVFSLALFTQIYGKLVAFKWFLYFLPKIVDFYNT